MFNGEKQVGRVLGLKEYIYDGIFYVVELSEKKVIRKGKTQDKIGKGVEGGGFGLVLGGRMFQGG